MPSSCIGSLAKRRVLAPIAQVRRTNGPNGHGEFGAKASSCEASLGRRGRGSGLDREGRGPPDPRQARPEGVSRLRPAHALRNRWESVLLFGSLQRTRSLGGPQRAGQEGAGSVASVLRLPGVPFDQSWTRLAIRIVGRSASVGSRLASSFYEGSRMAIRIKARAGETAEQMLRRFKKVCEKEGLTKDVKRKQYYEKPSERRRRDARRTEPRSMMVGGRSGSAGGSSSGPRAGGGSGGGRGGARSGGGGGGGRSGGGRSGGGRSGGGRSGPRG